MPDCMTFPVTVEEFMEQYKVVDTDGVYMSKGSELVPIFRMRQWFEHLSSAQPQRMIAKWISTTSLQEGQITWRDYKCSNCSHHRGKPMNFCEVCGAKMER